MNAYILQDLNDPNKLKIEYRSSPAGTITEAPKDENGKYILDIEIIDVVNMLHPDTDEIIGKMAQVNEAKRANKESSDQAAALENSLQSLRSERDIKLQACDWTQGQDAKPTLTASQVVAWAKYRQALRELPDNTEDPTNPTWPNEPK